MSKIIQNKNNPYTYHQSMQQPILLDLRYKYWGKVHIVWCRMGLLMPTILDVKSSTKFIQWTRGWSILPMEWRSLSQKFKVAIVILLYHSTWKYKALLDLRHQVIIKESFSIFKSMPNAYASWMEQNIPLVLIITGIELWKMSHLQ